MISGYQLLVHRISQPCQPADPQGGKGEGKGDGKGKGRDGESREGEDGVTPGFNR